MITTIAPSNNTRINKPLTNRRTTKYTQPTHPSSRLRESPPPIQPDNPYNDDNLLPLTPPSPAASAQKNLLIIAADPIVRRVLAWLTALDGWHVHPSDANIDICKTIHQQNIHALLIDHHLQPLNGLQHIVPIRNSGIQIPIILLTADPYLITPAQTQPLHLTAILPKPPDVFELRRVLNRTCQTAC